ncbi:MAG: prepilin-type N-terminal cleavage/methylation domain-containing protein [Candidatus Ozemobacteraceae bacterium]
MKRKVSYCIEFQLMPKVVTYPSFIARNLRGFVHNRVNKGKSGFTLLEVVFGMAIFATVSIGFIMYLQNATKESQFSGEHLTALILSQKVLEDINEELFLNPYGFETLGIDKTSSGKLEIVDGKSVYFSYLEDKKAPWGKIDPQQDGMLTSSMSPLYETVKPFRFKVYGDRLEKTGNGENRNVLTCDLNFDWETKTGAGKYSNFCFFFSPVTEKKADLALTVNEAGVDARIPTEFYHSSGKSLIDIANAANESVEAVTSLGRIALVTQDFMNSTGYKKTVDNIKTLGAKLANVPEGYFDEAFNYRLALAQAWYELAKLSFQVVAYLEPAFTQFATGSSFQDIGKTSVDPIAFQKALYSYKIIFGTFTGSLVQARSEFYALVKNDIATYKGGKKQLQVLQKLFDLYRIAAIIPTRPEGMNELKAFLVRLDKFSEYRNPFLNRMIKQELIFLGDRTGWVNRYSNLKRLDTILTGKIPPILAFIDAKAKDAIVNYPSPFQ